VSLDSCSFFNGAANTLRLAYSKNICLTYLGGINVMSESGLTQISHKLGLNPMGLATVGLGVHLYF
jgi:hypothetical protein